MTWLTEVLGLLAVVGVATWYALTERPDGGLLPPRCGDRAHRWVDGANHRHVGQSNVAVSVTVKS